MKRMWSRQGLLAWLLGAISAGQVPGLDTEEYAGQFAGSESLTINSSYIKTVKNYKELQFIFNCRITNETEESVTLSSDTILCNFGVLPDRILEKIYGHSGNKLTEATSNESVAYATLFVSQPAGVVASTNPKYVSLYFRKASKTLAFYLEGGNISISASQSLDFEARISLYL